MTFQEEKEIYKEKLKSCVDGITDIMKLSLEDILSDIQKRDMVEYKKKAEELFRKLDKEEFEIAVVGLEKAGKSSFSNAYIDSDVLPTDDQRCTYTSTCIKYGEKKKGTVRFYTVEEFNRDFQDKLRIMGIDKAEQYTYDTLGLVDYRRLFEGLPDSTRGLYRNSLNLDVEMIIQNHMELSGYLGRGDETKNGNDIDGSEFKEFITKPGKAIAVKEIVIKSDKLEKTKNAIIYDVPGFNSPTKLHKEQTEEKMKQVDAIIMVASAKEPSLTGEVCDIFTKVKDTEGNPINEKLFVFANKADMARDLEKNKEVLYYEWTTKNSFLPKEHKDRIVTGSAIAHLGSKTPQGEEARAVMEKKGLSDGIDEMKSLIEVYSKTEHFKILKQRVDSIISKLKEMFLDIRKSSYDDSSSDTELTHMVLTVFGEIQKTLPKSLAALRAEVNEDEIDGKLSEQLKTTMSEMVTVEKYEIDDDKLREVHIEKAGNGIAEQPNAVEPEIRDQKFREMHMDFGKQTYKLAGEKYKELREKVRQKFFEACEMTPESGGYEMFSEKIDEFIEIDNTAEGEYFQSLIDRFSRDLYEILIKKNRGQDRYNKFIERKENYLSLGVFYNASICKGENKDKNDEDAYQYLEEPLDKCDMWKMLIWPEIYQSKKSNSNEQGILSKISDVTGIDLAAPTSNGLVKSIKQLISQHGADSMDLISELLKGFVRGETPSQTFNLALSLFKNALNVESERDEIQLKDLILQKNVKIRRNYNKEASASFTYQDIRKEFAADIEVLQHVLLNALIPAINIDRAYSARAVNFIDKILEKVNGSDLRDLVKKNIRLIAADQYSNIDREKEKRKRKEFILRQVNDILDKIDD